MQAPALGKSLTRIAQVSSLALRASTFWAPRRTLPFVATPLMLIALALLDLAAVVAAGYLAAPAGSTFDPAGLPMAAGSLLLILVIATLSAGWLLPETRLVDVIGVAFAALFLIDLVWALLQFWQVALDQIDALWPVSLPLSGVMAPWIGLSIGMFLGGQTRSAWRALLVTILAAFAIGVPTAMFDRAALAWVAPDTQQTDANDQPSETVQLDETLLYGEEARLDEQLASLAPRTPGRINVYFIGFAGNGEQMVFSHEVDYVKDLLEKRFGAAGHSVVLMNNLSTPGRVPLATAISLQQTLAAVGQRVSKEDVVVVFLSSHGSRESGINVDLPPFEFQDIDPDTLADMFKDANIHQRVVIVSACYAGIFVPALANPDTLVITAADATHTSFGCSNEADFTYFGQAYFHDALASGNSFSDAYQKALPMIRKRETEQGFQHSNPQMAMGSNIQKTLRRLEDQLAHATAAPASSAARPDDKASDAGSATP